MSEHEYQRPDFADRLISDIKALRARLSAADALLGECRERLRHRDWCAAYDTDETERCGGIESILRDRISAHLAAQETRDGR